MRINCCFSLCLKKLSPVKKPPTRTDAHSTGGRLMQNPKLLADFDQACTNPNAGENRTHSTTSLGLNLFLPFLGLEGRPFIAT